VESKTRSLQPQLVGQAGKHVGKGDTISKLLRMLKAFSTQFILSRLVEVFLQPAAFLNSFI